MIDTPSGQIPVEDLRQGMLIWALNDAGERVEATIVKTAVTSVSPDFLMVKITLSDGRTVTASPGHPTADNKPLGDYLVGDILDGAVVSTVGKVPDQNGVTYDILPSGGTGLYWGNGILLKSTLTE